MHRAVTQGKGMYGCVSMCTSVLFCCVSVGLGKLLVHCGLEYTKQPIIKESLTDPWLRALVNLKEIFSFIDYIIYSCMYTYIKDSQSNTSLVNTKVTVNNAKFVVLEIVQIIDFFLTIFY